MTQRDLQVDSDILAKHHVTKPIESSDSSNVEWWKIEGAIKKLQPTIIAIFDYVLLFHKFYVSNNFYPLLIKKCLKEVLQNPGNPGLLPLVSEI